MSNVVLKRHKDALARLLAAENIRVVHKNIDTAYFDLATRTLALPNWENITPAVYDLLVGHEVGHALYTPLEGWHTAVEPRGALFKSYLNVVEDARIEYMVKTLYPGMVARFEAGYVDLYERGFFGNNKGVDIKDRIFIDRINIHCKCGIKAMVPFSPEEFELVKKVESTETWEDVRAVTEEIFNFVGVKTVRVKSPDKEMESLREFADELSEEYGSDDDYSGIEDGDEITVFEDDSKKSCDKPLTEEPMLDYLPEENESPDKGSVDGETAEGSVDGETGEGDISTHVPDGAGGSGYMDGWEEPPAPTTDESLRENLKSLNGKMNDYDKIINCRISKYNVGSFIIPNNKVLKMAFTVPTAHVRPGYNFDKEIKNLREDCGIIGKMYFNHIKKSVDHMVREFEMRKSALHMARRSQKKTGVLDCVRMNRYKFDDDIFKKMTISPQGKNHGFIVYLDWSGSMCDEMLPAISQIALLAFFCKKINVPFRVYAFSNRGILNEEFPINVGQYNPGDLVPSETLRLLELYNENMSMKQIFQMTGVLFTNNAGPYVSSLNNQVWYDSNKFSNRERYESYYQSSYLSLASTPLNCSLLLAPQIHDQFKGANNLDIVNTIVITDGQSNGGAYIDDKGKFNSLDHHWYNKYYLEIPRGGYKKVIHWTDDLLHYYRSVTGSNTIGYFITYHAPRNVTNFKAKGWSAKSNSNGYDTFINIHPSILGEEQNIDDHLNKRNKSDNPSNGVLVTAMKKSGESKKKHRSLLTRISSICA